MKEAKFKVGDVVAKLRRGEVYGLGKVTRVNKRFVEVARVDRYQLDGRDTYPKSHDPWGGHCIRLATDDDREKLRRDRLVSLLRHTRWEELPIETLDRVAAELP